MDTLTATKLDTLTINAATLDDLLLGAIVAADKGKNSLPKLSAIYLSAGDGIVTVTATDRYRLIAGEVAGEGTLNETMIRLDDVKRITAAIKAIKRLGDITLDRVGDMLTVRINRSGDTLTITAGYDTFPPYKQLLAYDASAISELRLDVDLLASFAKVPSNGGGQHFTFTGDRKPIRITINHEVIKWYALLMPMKTNA
jgi:DNA polymerase III sliding clamp (beta) subunit (PCNA family)